MARRGSQSRVKVAKVSERPLSENIRSDLSWERLTSVLGTQRKGEARAR